MRGKLRFTLISSIRSGLYFSDPTLRAPNESALCFFFKLGYRKVGSDAKLFRPERGRISLILKSLYFGTLLPAFENYSETGK